MVRCKPGVSENVVVYLLRDPRCWRRSCERIATSMAMAEENSSAVIMTDNGAAAGALSRVSVVRKFTATQHHCRHHQQTTCERRRWEHRGRTFPGKGWATLTSPTGAHFLAEKAQQQTHVQRPRRSKTHNESLDNGLWTLTHTFIVVAAALLRSTPRRLPATRRPNF